MFTATNRKIDDLSLNWLKKEAYSGGIDFVHNWFDRKFFVNGKVFMSYVKGSTESIIETQRSSERYFQRPDNQHAEVDSTRQSLTGSGGNFTIGKRSGKLTYNLRGSWLSPGLDLNDIGYLQQTDRIRQQAMVQYRTTNPIGITRSQYYNVFQGQSWDFDGRSMSSDYEANAFFELKNFWEVGGGIGVSDHSASNADLRGGPSLLYPGNITAWAWLGSDRRKKLYFGFGPNWLWGQNNYLENQNYELNLVYRPINALNISISPTFSHSRNQMQYVTTGEVESDPRYVVGEIDQSTFVVSVRFTYMITPNLSIQYWGQPFGTSGQYTQFKYITQGSAQEYHERYLSLPASWLSFSGDQYHVDENNKGTTDFSFYKPDFNFGQFRSNMVLRWEYIPGSTVFLVWTQEMNGKFYSPADNVHNQYAFDFNQQAHNVFVMKFTYRFVL